MHIVQEFIAAPMLLYVWRKLKAHDRERCIIQLKGYIQQLRSLVPPKPGKVQSIGGKGLTDSRLRHDEWGPFESHERVRELPSQYPRAQASLAVAKGRTWRTVFAHGDLGPHNILWDMKKAEIAAIIDWEFSGWFPEYWEYTRA